MRLQQLALDRSPDRAAETISCDLRDWAPRVRIGCSNSVFRRFERVLSDRLGPAAEPSLTWIGSGDFHHVSLAMLRRVNVECNLLILDLHPDWMRGVPLMHCGTWVAHALKLPNVRRVFHLGGDIDFDNAFRWMAPWSDLRSGRVTVWPAVRRFRHWSCEEPLKENGARVTVARMNGLIRPFAGELARRPLYISLDKDVMRSEDAVVNWESGHLELTEACAILTAFIEAAGGRLAGMDVTGDWSPVEVRGSLRRLLDRTEHPPIKADAARAAAINDRTNTAIVAHLAGLGVSVAEPTGFLTYSSQHRGKSQADG